MKGKERGDLAKLFSIHTIIHLIGQKSQIAVVYMVRYIMAFTCQLEEDIGMDFNLN